MSQTVCQSPLTCSLAVSEELQVSSSKCGRSAALERESPFTRALSTYTDHSQTYRQSTVRNEGYPCVPFTSRVTAVLNPNLCLVQNITHSQTDKSTFEYLFEMVYKNIDMLVCDQSSIRCVLMIRHFLLRIEPKNMMVIRTCINRESGLYNLYKITQPTQAADE